MTNNQKNTEIKLLSHPQAMQLAQRLIKAAVDSIVMNQVSYPYWKLYISINHTGISQKTFDNLLAPYVNSYIIDIDSEYQIDVDKISSKNRSHGIDLSIPVKKERMIHAIAKPEEMGLLQDRIYAAEDDGTIGAADALGKPVSNYYDPELEADRKRRGL